MKKLKIKRKEVEEIISMNSDHLDNSAKNVGKHKRSNWKE